LFIFFSTRAFNDLSTLGFYSINGSGKCSFGVAELVSILVGQTKVKLIGYMVLGESFTGEYL
jgi:hypothetical protein